MTSNDNQNRNGCHQQQSGLHNAPNRPCIRVPGRRAVCHDKQGRWRRRNCAQCRQFQEARRQINNRWTAAASRTNRYNRRTALLAEIEANELRLAQVEEALNWQQAEKAAWQVQMEEVLIIRGNPGTTHHPGGDH